MDGNVVVRKRLLTDNVASDVFFCITDPNDKTLLQNILVTVLVARATEHEPHCIKWQDDERICLEFYSLSKTLKYKIIRDIIRLDPSRIERVIVGPVQVSSPGHAETNGEPDASLLRLEVVVRRAASGGNCSAQSRIASDVPPDGASVYRWEKPLPKAVLSSDAEVIREMVGSVLSAVAENGVPVIETGVSTATDYWYMFYIRGLEDLDSQFLARLQLAYPTTVEEISFRGHVMSAPNPEDPAAPAVRYHAMMLTLRWRKSTAPIRYAVITDGEADSRALERSLTGSATRRASASNSPSPPSHQTHDNISGKKRPFTLESESDTSESDDQRWTDGDIQPVKRARFGFERF